MTSAIFTKTPALALLLGLTSCGTMSTVCNTTQHQVAKLGRALNPFGPPSIQVVAVRAKTLKEQPSGHEQAIAYQSKARHGFWFFSGPVTFKEPTLPAASGPMDGSLLPPKPESAE